MGPSKIKVKILGEFNYQTFPITEDMIEVDENILAEIGVTKKFSNGKVVEYTKPVDHSIEIAVLKEKLKNTDYKAIKYAEGLITEEEYAEIKAQRQAWREEINHLEGEMK